MPWGVETENRAPLRPAALMCFYVVPSQNNKTVPVDACHPGGRSGQEKQQDERNGHLAKMGWLHHSCFAPRLLSSREILRRKSRNPCTSNI